MQRGRPLVPVGEPGRVPHQVLDGRLAARRLAIDHVAAAGVAAELHHAHVLERRQVGADRLVDEQPVLLGERQRRRGHDRLGHGRDAEDGVLGHRRALGLVEETERLVVHQLALARDRDDGAGHAALVDVVLERGRDAGQPLRRHAHAFRCGARQRVGVHANAEGGHQAGAQGGSRQTKSDAHHVSSSRSSVPSPVNASSASGRAPMSGIVATGSMPVQCSSAKCSPDRHAHVADAGAAGGVAVHRVIADVDGRRAVAHRARRVPAAAPPGAACAAARPRRRRSRPRRP